ncbi:transglycosylase SLT domain-containing protein, partial [Nocardia cyriacigeorgica]|uniref:transglycosylase SLT domain-containing protein n=1 Tax=Nocardia cyriacigeorgica TaxID=135487 RepID=UPI0021154759
GCCSETIATRSGTRSSATDTAEDAATAPIPAPMPAPPVYPDNLDGWIRQSLDIMAARGIPGSYDGIMRNIMRESTGNPQAINLWDSNAAAGIPSKGLLQVIDPTFAAYHVDGTPFDIWNPVSNIVAACNYAAHRYGSMDNVNSAY